MYPAFLILMKINFVLLLFVGAYYLVLKNFTFYTLNRFYLIFGILFSSCYPFINLTSLFNQHEEKLASVGEMVRSLNAQPVIKQQSFLDFWVIIITIIFIGIIVFMFRLLMQLFSLYKIHQNTTADEFQDFKIRRLKDKISPFSFWNNIYINPNIYSEKELNTILKHEKVHVDQLHTLDILFAELSTVFYWFNPGVWLMKKAIKENIEFITDAKILNCGTDRKEYQYNLLTVNKLKLQTNVVNSFNFSDIKTRIKMMNARKSAKNKLLIYLLILPLLLTTCLAFTVSVVKKDAENTLTYQLHKGLLPIMITKLPSKEPKQVVEMKGEATQDKKPKVVKSEEKSSISNQTKFIDIKRNLSTNDTIIHNPSFSISELNKMTNKMDVKDSTIENIKIAINPSAASANYKIKNIAIIKINNHPEINSKDSSKVTYYLNGKATLAKDMNNISTESIKSISIQKNKITGTGVLIESN